MAESPTLYVEIPHGGELRHVVQAERSEILSAARPHLDYEAAVQLIADRWSHILKENGVWIVDPRSMARSIVDAALGLTEEGS